MSDVDWIFPEPDIEVRQGDSLLRRDPRTGEILELCLVITADCDISKKKFGVGLACLRVEFLHDFVRTDWARSKLARLMSTERDKVRAQLLRWHNARFDTPRALSARAVDAWIVRATTDTICAELEIPQDERKKIGATIDSYRAAFTALGKCGDADELVKLATYKAALTGGEVATLFKEYVAQARNESLPEDVFLLPRVPQIEERAVLVKLRDLVAVDPAAIRYRASEADSAEHYLRTGRLQPTLKYAISQKFGHLYSKIGLSSDFESRHKTAIESVSQIELEKL